jgi:hypothetical protein
MAANPEEQAKVLCLLLGTSVPTDVSTAFAKMIGADEKKAFETYIDTAKEFGVSDIGKNSQGKRGVQHHGAKLTPDEVTDIFTNLYSAAAMSRKYDVNVTTIYDIRNRRTWTHVTQGLERPPKQMTKAEMRQRYPRRVGPLTIQEVQNIRQRFDRGEDRSRIAGDYNKSLTSISNIGERKTYQWVEEA